LAASLRAIRPWLSRFAVDERWFVVPDDDLCDLVCEDPDFDPDFEEWLEWPDDE
jgi:hypothetical protein